MLKITSCLVSGKDNLICKFNTGEEKIFDIKNSINDRFINTILSDREILLKFQIGDFGELLWENIGELKDFNGKLENCSYDISPEFVYNHSTKFTTDKSLA